MKFTSASPLRQPVVSLYTRNQQTGRPTTQATKPTGAAFLKAVWLLISTDAYKRRTKLLRTAKAGMQSAYKANLHAVTPGGTFAGRKLETILVRSGWLVLDFDNVSPSAITGLREELLHDPILGPSIVLAFISPRGAGLKVWVRIDLKFKHGECFNTVIDYLKEVHPKWAEKVDPSGSDITRLCFLSHDPNAYLNPNHAIAPPFPMPAKDESDIFDDSYDPNLFVNTGEVNLAFLERWVSAAEQVADFADDRAVWRNLGFAFASIGEEGRNFFHRVSRTSKKYDEKENDEKFSYWLKKYNGSIKLGTFFHYCKEAGIVPASIEQSDTAANSQTLPAIPSELYAQMPIFLQKCCSPFQSAHERDIMLRSTLGILSGCLPSVGGTYGQREYGLNIFLFIIGPAASGKGTMLWAKRLAQPYHKRLIAKSAAEWAQYEAKMAAYKTAVKKEENKLNTPPSPPARLLLYLPGNSTAAAVLRALAESKGRGIICETEADTLSNALRSDYGGFSDVLRAIFEHEPVTMLRQTDRVHIDLDRPALSIVLTGTPGQFQRLVPSTEDGFASRFLIHRFDQVPVWKDVSPNAGPALDSHFDSLAKELDGLLDALPEPTEGTFYPVRITLAPADWKRVNAGGEAGLSEAWQEMGDAGASTAKRLGLIAWRIVGILTVLRCYERGVPLSGELIADPMDVTIALSIMDVARAHAIATLDALPAPYISKAGNKRDIRNTQRNEAVALRAQGQSLGEIAKRLGIAKSTIQAWCN